MERTEECGAEFAASVRHVLAQEGEWVDWKDGQCLPFDRPPEAPLHTDLPTSLAASLLGKQVGVRACVRACVCVCVCVCSWCAASFYPYRVLHHTHTNGPAESCDCCQQAKRVCPLPNGRRSTAEASC